MISVVSLVVMLISEQRCGALPLPPGSGMTSRTGSGVLCVGESNMHFGTGSRLFPLAFHHLGGPSRPFSMVIRRLRTGWYRHWAHPVPLLLPIWASWKTSAWIAARRQNWWRRPLWCHETLLGSARGGGGSAFFTNRKKKGKDTELPSYRGLLASYLVHLAHFCKNLTMTAW